MARSFSFSLTTASPSIALNHDGGALAAFATLAEGQSISLTATGYSTEAATIVGSLTNATQVVSLRLPGCRLTATAANLGESTAVLTIGRA